MGTLIGAVVFVAVILVAIFLIKLRFPGLLGPPERGASGKDPASLCRLSPELLSPAERAFFTVLRSVASDRYGVLAKVRVGDILNVPGQGSAQATARNKIQMKHADFVLCDPVTTRPRLVIELDDRSHEREERKHRDGFLDRAYASAGLPILHVRAAASYSPANLAREVDARVNPSDQPEGTVWGGRSAGGGRA